MGVTAQSSPKMNGLLVLSTLAAASALATVLPYGLGLGYHGLGYAGLGYAGLHYPYHAVAAPAPVEVEVPVTQYRYVPEVKTVELPPACQNAFGFAVPCA